MVLYYDERILLSQKHEAIDEMRRDKIKLPDLDKLMEEEFRKYMTFLQIHQSKNCIDLLLKIKS